MEPAELLVLVASVLDRLGIRYLVTGSMATVAYGEPRLTNDIDVVVRLAPTDADRLCAAFPADQFCVSREAALVAIATGGQFNILVPASGLKVDLFAAADTEFNASRFSRLRRLTVSEGATAAFASPEDVILKKLEYYREGGSDKHLRDIAGVLRVMGAEVDREYIARWAHAMGLEELWTALLARLG